MEEVLITEGVNPCGTHVSQSCVTCDGELEKRGAGMTTSGGVGGWKGKVGGVGDPGKCKHGGGNLQVMGDFDVEAELMHGEEGQSLPSTSDGV